MGFYGPSSASMKRGCATLITACALAGCGSSFEAISTESDASITNPQGTDATVEQPSNTVIDVGTSSDVGVTTGEDVRMRDAISADVPVVHVDAAPETGPIDAARDAAAEVGSTCTPITCPPITLECVPMSGVTGGGLTLSSMFSVGWRFQVPAGHTITLKQAGILYRPTVATGTLFAAIVPLGGPTVNPKVPLLPADVLAAGIVGPFNGIMPQLVTVPFSVILPPGWYAVVFGTDQLGAMAASGSIEKMGKAMMCANGQNPFSLRSTGEFISQAADPYIFVQMNQM